MKQKLQQMQGDTDRNTNNRRLSYTTLSAVLDRLGKPKMR